MTNEKECDQQILEKSLKDKRRQDLIQKEIQRERQIPYDLTHRWDLKKPTKLIEKEIRLVVTRAEGGEGRGGRWAKVQTSCYRHYVPGRNVPHDNPGQRCCATHRKAVDEWILRVLIKGEKYFPFFFFLSSLLIASA